ncbi:MAG: hypothetical protein KAU31_05895, partial [Spirochaetaceae bacterium]|nr:hypothetical protein [Spirochaetaceae bacterium]
DKRVAVGIGISVGGGSVVEQPVTTINPVVTNNPMKTRIFDLISTLLPRFDSKRLNRIGPAT